MSSYALPCHTPFLRRQLLPSTWFYRHAHKSTSHAPGKANKRALQRLRLVRWLLLDVRSTLPLHNVLSGGFKGAASRGEVQQAANHVALCVWLAVWLAQCLVHLAALEVAVAEALVVVADLRGWLFCFGIRRK